VWISAAAEYYARAILEIVRRVQYHLRSGIETSNDLCLRGIAVPDFNRKSASPAVLDHERIPLLSSAE
jgi:hypothetical protein